MQGHARERLRHARCTREELAERLRQFVTTSYFTTLDLMAGGVIAVASLVLLEIVTNAELDWLRSLLWVTSLLSFLAVRAFTRIGALLSNPRFNAGDQIYPVLIGFAEMCSFVFLTDRFVHDGFAVAWALAIAGSMGFNGLLIDNRIRQLHPARDYADDAQEFVAAYLDWHRRGRRGSFLWAAAAVIFAVVTGLMVRSGAEAGAAAIMATFAVAASSVAMTGLGLSGRVFARFSRLLELDASR